MLYECVDRGRLRCPCALMEAGQCYSCTMLRTGRCSCSDLWSGTCPYTEFLQNGSKAVPAKNVFDCKVTQIREYDKGLVVIQGITEQALMTRLRQVGSFVMVQTDLEFPMPVSVLTAKYCDENSGCRLDLAIQPVGPKSVSFIEQCRTIGKFQFKGPFFSGLVNGRRIEYDKNLLVVARGIAIAPFLNIKDIYKYDLLLDKHKLTDDFILDYLGNVDFELINLDVEGDLEDIVRRTDEYDRILFLASPYHTFNFLEMHRKRKNDIIFANNANMCCGIGICGACSHTDADGVTIRRCKCTEI